MVKIEKRNGSIEKFNIDKIINAVNKAFVAVGEYPGIREDILKEIKDYYRIMSEPPDLILTVEHIQDWVEKTLMGMHYYEEAKEFILYREKRKQVREFVKKKKRFINSYKESSNTANATVDDNSNVSGKNIGILNSEIHKEDNILVNRGMIMDKLKELYPDFDSKQYIKDLENHIIYKHDENSFAGAISPYCCSITMYPFLLNGLKDIGGLSAAPKNLDSFCGMYINLIFAISAQFAGAVATSEFLLYFDYFARKEWGDFYYLDELKVFDTLGNKTRTIKKQIHQYFQQTIYSINQPAAARGMQSAFVNFSIFDKPFFNGMFGEFYFPDGTQPKWDSFYWLQKEFLHWFNQERLKCILTFPVVSCTLLFKDGEFQDKEMYDFICQEYSEGNSFFLYISDTVDSLSSCCRLKNKIQSKEFNFTNGNIGVQTGSKSVISLNLNRIIQDWWNSESVGDFNGNITEYKIDSIAESKSTTHRNYNSKKLSDYLIAILDRVYKYQTAYNELLWDMYNSNLLPVYKAGFIDLNKQYLTIGLIGLTAAAEFLEIGVYNNKEYKEFCNFIFNTIKEQNQLHKTPKTTWNTELVPAESAALKLYNADKKDGYFVPEDINLYTSYIFKPYDITVPILDKIMLHGKNYIGDYLDGGSACHLNLEEHLSKNQYNKILLFAAQNGCQYLTFNIPNCECNKCGFIAKQPFKKCPKCGSVDVSLWDRIIGYLTKITNWSEGRQIEQKTRVYSNGTNI